MSMTQTTNLEAPASYDLSGDLAEVGEWKLEAIEGDNATLDVTLSVSSTVELNAAIEAMIALRDTMAQAEEFRGER
jgi:hypothetical protein